MRARAALTFPTTVVAPATLAPSALALCSQLTGRLTRPLRMLGLVLLAAGLSVLLVRPAAAATPIGMLKQFRVPTANSQPRFITNGADGNRWFVEGNAPNIGRITPAGDITEFGPACQACLLSDIVQGAAGILYYTSNDPALGRITTSGEILPAVAIPNSTAVGGDIAAHGNEIWFNDFNNDALWRYDTVSGQFTRFDVPEPLDVAVDPAGIVWFPSSVAQAIGRLDPTTGAVSLAPTKGSPSQITVAANGDVWFTDPAPVAGPPPFGEAVGRVHPATMAVSEFPVGPGVRPLGIAAAPAAASPFGPVWFTQNAKGNVAAITDQGVITEGKAVKGSDPLGVTVDATGNPWYAMRSANKIAKLQLR